PVSGECCRVFDLCVQKKKEEDFQRVTGEIRLFFIFCVSNEPDEYIYIFIGPMPRQLRKTGKTCFS
ncbi:MAG: hypothetical protein LBN31_11765, partial [Hungatella sp.]|nr:hypothetical protein [Hungatella sp.]